MDLVWVTGTSGVGKSTVSGALNDRGYLSFDADEGGIAVWRSRETHEVVTDWTAGGRPDNRAAQHAWVVVRERVEALADITHDRTVFLCGSVENEVEVWDLFAVVVCLVADDATLVKRLTARVGDAFGTSPEELAAILGWNATAAESYRGVGAVLVDATRPIDIIVEEVISASQAFRPRR